MKKIINSLCFLCIGLILNTACNTTNTLPDSSTGPAVINWEYSSLYMPGEASVIRTEQYPIQTPGKKIYDSEKNEGWENLQAKAAGIQFSFESQALTSYDLPYIEAAFLMNGIIMQIKKLPLFLTSAQGIAIWKKQNFILKFDKESIKFNQVQVWLYTGDYRTSITELIVTPYEDIPDSYKNMSSMTALVLMPLEDQNSDLIIKKDFEKTLEAKLYTLSDEAVWKEEDLERPATFSLISAPPSTTIDSTGKVHVAYLPPYGKTSIEALATYRTNSDTLITATTFIPLMKNTPPILNINREVDSSYINVGTATNVLLFDATIKDDDFFLENQRIFIQVSAPPFCKIERVDNAITKEINIKVTATTLINSKFSVSLTINDGFAEPIIYTKTINVQAPTFTYIKNSTESCAFQFISGSPKKYDMNCLIAITGKLNASLTPDIVNFIKASPLYLIRGRKLNHNESRDYGLIYSPSNVIADGANIKIYYDISEESTYYQNSNGGSPQTKFRLNFQGIEVFNRGFNTRWYDVRLQY